MSHRIEELLTFRGVYRSHHVAVRPMMSEETKSLNATPKPEPKDETTAAAAGTAAAGPVELTAMVNYNPPLLELMLTKVRSRIY